MTHDYRDPPLTFKIMLPASEKPFSVFTFMKSRHLDILDMTILSRYFFVVESDGSL